jgi:hypothetical protein
MTIRGNAIIIYLTGRLSLDFLTSVLMALIVSGSPWWALEEPVNGSALRNTATTAIIMLMYVYRAQPRHNLDHRNCMCTHCIVRVRAIPALVVFTGEILFPPSAGD